MTNKKGHFRQKILIVDDQPDWRYLVSSALKAKFKEADITEANSAADAIVKLRQEDYRLVVCDYHMPGGSGLEVFAYLEVEEPQGDTSFILFTSSLDASALTEKMIVVFKDAKHELLDAVDFLLGGSRGR